jgi:oligopeptide/dipeptide ABC transporter ATP-binding protein
VSKLVEPTAGKICFDGTDLRGIRGKMKKWRKRIQIIFQDADGSLNPRMKTADLLLEPLRIHSMTNGRGKQLAVDLLHLVNLPPDLMDRHPHELSGGQRQRIGIARAISLGPDLIIADEAAASLDLLVQTAMVDLMKRLQEERGVSYLYISHNLDIVKRIANRTAVMYLGKLVEVAETTDLFDKPVHPYTKALLSAIPKIDPAGVQKDIVLEGEIPSPLNPPDGCRFHGRCFQKRKVCSELEPELREIGNHHFAACHFVPSY